MLQQNPKLRFENARKRLSSALKEIEKITTDKLEQSKNSVNKNSSDQQNKFLEQENLIQNLNDELNNLQQALAEAGKETEFYNEKSKALADKMNQFRVQSLSLVNVIESDLSKIYSIIKKENNA